MKIRVQEIESEGLLALLGKRITLLCVNYIYTGELVGINESCVKLKDAAIVYETGELGSSTWKDAQKLPKDWYVQLSAVESFGELK
jgi:hypothetical protein